MNGDDASGSDTDDYAGLMTLREKQWLINIQMLQLNTGTPYIHDFYYTVSSSTTRNLSQLSNRHFVHTIHQVIYYTVSNSTTRIK